MAIFERHSGQLAFQILTLKDHISAEMQRHNYYSILLISSGEAELQIEFANYQITGKTVVCISPYQPHAIIPQGELTGTILNFHPDFYCTYKHQNEIPTEGILFNNVQQPPHFPISDDAPLLAIQDQMKAEMARAETGQHELLVSYLKIFLILCLQPP